MSRIERINKPIVLKFEDRKIELPINLKKSINRFWSEAVEEKFNRLIFLDRKKALIELDTISNYKRPYLRSLIEKIICLKN